MSDKTIIRLSSKPQGFGETPDELTEDMFASALSNLPNSPNLPIQHNHEYYVDEDLGLYIGVWDTTDMIEVAQPYEVDEFMWLLEGEVEIKNNKTGLMEKVKAGEAFVIPRGYDCQWHQSGYLRKFYVSAARPQENMPEKPAKEGIIVFDCKAQLAPAESASLFSLSSLSSATPAQQHIYYQNSTGSFQAGIWQSDEFDSTLYPQATNEFAYVQTGSITLTDKLGVEHPFNQGEAFFIPKGLICSAKSLKGVTLFFAIMQET